MKVDTQRFYEVTNGYSTGGFQIKATTKNKKIVKFTLDVDETATPDLMRLLCHDLQIFADRIDAEETK